MKTIAELKALLTGKYDYIHEYPYDDDLCKVRFCVEEYRHLFQFEVNLSANTMWIKDQAAIYTLGTTPEEVLELYVRVHDFVKASGIKIVR